MRARWSAPVEEGTPVGTLSVWIGDTLSQETPLFAAETVRTRLAARSARSMPSGNCWSAGCVEPADAPSRSGWTCPRAQRH